MPQQTQLESLDELIRKRREKSAKRAEAGSGEVQEATTTDVDDIIAERRERSASKVESGDVSAWEKFTSVIEAPSRLAQKFLTGAGFAAEEELGRKTEEITTGLTAVAEAPVAISTGLGGIMASLGATGAKSLFEMVTGEGSLLSSDYDAHAWMRDPKSFQDLVFDFADQMGKNKDFREKVAEMFTIHPSTETGEAMMRTAFVPFEAYLLAVDEGLKAMGVPEERRVGLGMIAEAAAFIVGGKLHKRRAKPEVSRLDYPAGPPAGVMPEIKGYLEQKSRVQPKITEYPFADFVEASRQQGHMDPILENLAKAKLRTMPGQEGQWFSVDLPDGTVFRISAKNKTEAYQKSIDYMSEHNLYQRKGGRVTPQPEVVLDAHGYPVSPEHLKTEMPTAPPGMETIPQDVPVSGLGTTPLTELRGEGVKIPEKSLTRPLEQKPVAVQGDVVFQNGEPWTVNDVYRERLTVGEGAKPMAGDFVYSMEKLQPDRPGAPVEKLDVYRKDFQERFTTEPISDAEAVANRHLGIEPPALDVRKREPYLIDAEGRPLEPRRDTLSTEYAAEMAEGERGPGLDKVDQEMLGRIERGEQRVPAEEQHLQYTEKYRDIGDPAQAESVFVNDKALLDFEEKGVQPQPGQRYSDPILQKKYEESFREMGRGEVESRMRQKKKSAEEMERYVEELPAMEDLPPDMRERAENIPTSEDLKAFERLNQEEARSLSEADIDYFNSGMNPFIELRKLKDKLEREHGRDMAWGDFMKTDAAKQRELELFRDDIPYRSPERPYEGAGIESEAYRPRKLKIETEKVYSKYQKHGFDTSTHRNYESLIRGWLVPTGKTAGTFRFEITPDWRPTKGINTGRFQEWMETPSYWANSIDGVTKAQMIADSKQGPTSHNFLTRIRDWKGAKNDMRRELRFGLRSIAGNHGILDNKGARKVAGELVREINRDEWRLPLEDIKTKDGVSQILAKYPRVGERALAAAMDLRQMWDATLDMQNISRRRHGDNPINTRVGYMPDQLKDRTLWDTFFPDENYDKMMSRLEKEMVRTPEHIQPDRPFVPHTKEHKGKIPKSLLEKDPFITMQGYIDGALRDIFNPDVVQLGKEWAKVLEDKGAKGAGDLVRTYVNDTFVKGKTPMAVDLPVMRRGLQMFRRALNMAVFPYNLKWVLWTQPKSLAFSMWRHPIETPVAGVEWFTNPAKRKLIRTNSAAMWEKGVPSERGYRSLLKGTDTGYEGFMEQPLIGDAPRTGLRRSPAEVWNDAGRVPIRMMEDALTGISELAEYNYLKRKGFTENRDFWNQVSEGGWKTQSGYSMEERAKFTKSELVRSAAPYQGFSAEGMNQWREALGKTGVADHTAFAKTKNVMKLVGAISTMNLFSELTGTRKLAASAFVPFWNNVMAPIFSGDMWKAGKQALPGPVSAAVDLRNAIVKYVKDDDDSRLISWAVQWIPGAFGIGGGSTAARIIREMMYED